MTFEEFKNTLNNDSPPDYIKDHILALWWDANSGWEKAHGIVQNLTDKNAAWIHAYLHRKEGDDGNARYWYRRAGKSFPTTSLDDEWNEISNALIY